MDVADLIKAITHTMTCNKCPCSCKAREKSSQANCDRHWFEMLTDVKTIHPWIPTSERLLEEYGEYRITWTTSASKKRFVGDAEYEVTDEWDDKRNDFKGEWLLDDYIKAYPDVNVIAWKPIEEPWEGEQVD